MAVIDAKQTKFHQAEPPLWQTHLGSRRSPMGALAASEIRAAMVAAGRGLRGPGVGPSFCLGAPRLLPPRTHRLGEDTYPMALREVSQPETDNHCPHCEGLTERFKMVLTPWYESAEVARKKSMDVSGWNRRCTNGECPGRKGLPVDD